MTQAVSVYYPKCLAVLSVIFDGRQRADSEPVQIVTAPRSATVNLNGYHEADTWDLEFDGRILPLDPHLIRSAVAAIYLFNDSSLATPIAPLTPDRQRIVGLVDEASLSLSDSGQTVSWSGRDYTALLLDIEWDPRKRVPTGRKLSQVVQSIIKDAGIDNMDVVFESDARDPILSNAFRAAQKRGRAVTPGKNVWDVVYELCTSVGFITYVEGEQVIITEPRVQTEKSAAKAPVLVYGRNLSELESRRKLGKERVPQIVATSRDPRTGKVFRAVYPQKHQSPKTGIGTKRDERLRVTAPAGIRDRATLQRFARTYYETIARAEATYRFRTRHLASLDGQDLLAIRAGTPILLEFDAFNDEQMRQLSGPQREEHLKSLGYAPELAGFVAVNYDQLGQFRQPYYLRSASLRFSSEDGLEIDGEAANYAFVPREESVS